MYMLHMAYRKLVTVTQTNIFNYLRPSTVDCQVIEISFFPDRSHLHSQRKNDEEGKKKCKHFLCFLMYFVSVSGPFLNAWEKMRNLLCCCFGHYCVGFAKICLFFQQTTAFIMENEICFPLSLVWTNLLS